MREILRAMKREKERKRERERERDRKREKRRLRTGLLRKLSVSVACERETERQRETETETASERVRDIQTKRHTERDRDCFQNKTPVSYGKTQTDNYTDHAHVEAHIHPLPSPAMGGGVEHSDEGIYGYRSHNAKLFERIEHSGIQ